MCSSDLAWVALGSLSPADVDVQVVHGRIGSDDVLTGTAVAPMEVGESYDGNRHRFDATVPLAERERFKRMRFEETSVTLNDLGGDLAAIEKQWLSDKTGAPIIATE